MHDGNIINTRKALQSLDTNSFAFHSKQQVISRSSYKNYQRRVSKVNERKPKLVDNKGINFTDLGGSSTIIESEQESKKQYKKA